MGRVRVLASLVITCLLTAIFAGCVVGNASGVDIHVESSERMLGSECDELSAFVCFWLNVALTNEGEDDLLGVEWEAISTRGTLHSAQNIEGSDALVSDTTGHVRIYFWLDSSDADEDTMLTTLRLWVPQNPGSITPEYEMVAEAAIPDPINEFTVAGDDSDDSAEMTLVEEPPVASVAGPFAICSGGDCYNLGVLNESLSWSVNSKPSEDEITLMGAVQAKSEKMVEWRHMLVKIVNSDGEVIGEGWYTPMTSGFPPEPYTRSYLDYGEKSLFYIQIEIGAGESQFISHFDFGFQAQNLTFDYSEAEGLSYSVDSTEVLSNNRATVHTTWSNEETRAVTGYVFLMVYDDQGRAQGLERSDRVTVPAAGSTQVALTTDGLSIIDAEPASYSISFQKE